MSDEPGLNGRIALVTGAAGSFGSTVAAALASLGAHVVLADIEAAAAGLATTREACGRDRSTVVTFDVTDQDQVASAFDQTVADIGTPDLVFNNAGYQGAFTPTLDYSASDFATVLDVNVTGVFHVMQQAARAMVAAGVGGSIVNSASMAKTGAPNMVAYSASKAAVIGLTRSASKDLAPHGIRVNSISPAFIGPGPMWDRQVEEQARVSSRYYGDAPAVVAEQMIGQVPMGRYGAAEEVADVVLFLLSDASSYLTGNDIEISGGI